MSTKVLVVDDQEVLRRLVKLSLDGHGYEFSEATSGDEALEIIPKFEPDLVILDVMMPGNYSGYQVCEKIKNDIHTAHVKVILLTARGQRTDLAEGKRVQADGYMVKPFSPMDLVIKVHGLLE